MFDTGLLHMYFIAVIVLLNSGQLSNAKYGTATYTTVANSNGKVMDSVNGNVDYNVWS